MLGLPSLKFSSPTIFRISLSVYSTVLAAQTKILGIILDSHPLSYSPSNSTSNKWAENLVTYHTFSIILLWFKSPQPLLKLVSTVPAPLAILYSTKHSDWSLWNRNQITSFHSSNLPRLFLQLNSLTISSQNEWNSPTLQHTFLLMWPCFLLLTPTHSSYSHHKDCFVIPSKNVSKRYHLRTSILAILYSQKALPPNSFLIS